MRVASAVAGLAAGQDVGPPAVGLLLAGEVGERAGDRLLRLLRAAQLFQQRLSGRDGSDPSADWFEILPTTELQPDTRHRFRVHDERPITQARLNIHPDGGMARVRLFGKLTAEGLRDIRQSWDVSG